MPLHFLEVLGKLHLQTHFWEPVGHLAVWYRTYRYVDPAVTIYPVGITDIEARGEMIGGKAHLCFEFV